MDRLVGARSLALAGQRRGELPGDADRGTGHEDMGADDTLVLNRGSAELREVAFSAESRTVFRTPTSRQSGHRLCCQAWASGLADAC
jgi:hypothetical protein